MSVPLARALSKLGIMSRTEATRRILAGDVRVGGRIVRDPGFPVIPERARIAVGDAAAARQPALTIVLNKPRGVVTTRRDPQGRRTIYDVLECSGTAATQRLPYLAPVGRLDMASTGLLLLTNDSRLSDWLLDPKNEVTRAYVLTVAGELTDEHADRARRGLRDRGEILKAHRMEVLKRSRRETHLRVELLEGKNRELRRLFAALGHDVTRLKRIAFGGLELGTLPPGAWRPWTAPSCAPRFRRGGHGDPPCPHERRTAATTYADRRGRRSSRCFRRDSRSPFSCFAFSCCSGVRIAHTSL